MKSFGSGESGVKHKSTSNEAFSLGEPKLQATCLCGDKTRSCFSNKVHSQGFEMKHNHMILIAKPHNVFFYVNFTF